MDGRTWFEKGSLGASNDPNTYADPAGRIDKSRSLELNARPTHELIVGSQLIVYENAAHGLPYTRTPIRVLADILAFAGA